MKIYSQDDLLRIAKRINNTRRTYLLVDPLQAKHIPASPSAALEMMETLGDMLAQKYPGTRLVVGFAETATAIGAAAASRFGGACLYLPTTREDIPGTDWVLFQEEHSHATQQKLWGGGLEERIRDTETVIFVDDEISTGKTLINMISQLRSRFPGLGEKRLVAASLLNRVSPEDEERLKAAGLHCEYLVKLTGADPAGAVSALRVEEAPPAEGREHSFRQKALDCGSLPEPRRGVLIRDYLADCKGMVQAFLSATGPELEGIGSAVVLGTEECMYPALVLGKALEGRGISVRCHATTRSPIGVCDAPGYPITSGRKLGSFYEAGRDTYIYNLSPCGALIVVSDAPACRLEALNQLSAAWAAIGYQKLFFIQGGRHVWYI